MRLIASLFFLSVLSTSALLAADPPAPAPSVRSDLVVPQRDVMTNEGVVLLSDAGFSDSFIVEKMLLTRGRFDTSVEGLAYLLRNGISPELVQFILERSARPSVAPAQPAYVPMKVAKRKVLVPDNKVLAAAPAAAPMVLAAAPNPPSAARWYVVNGYPYPVVANGYGWLGAAQAAYTVPYPVLQSPTLPVVPSAPIMTPATTTWFAGR